MLAILGSAKPRLRGRRRACVGRKPGSRGSPRGARSRSAASPEDRKPGAFRRRPSNSAKSRARQCAHRWAACSTIRSGRAAEQTTQESQARFPRPGAASRGPVGADVGGETAFAGMARAGVVHGLTKGALLSPARSTASTSARKSSSLAVKSRTTWRLEIMSPRPVRSATILSQVIWP